MLINIFGQLDLQFNLLTEIIKNVTQFNELMSLLQLSSHDMYICYQVSTDGDKGVGYHSNCISPKQIFLFELDNEDIIGGFFSKEPMRSKEGQYTMKDNNAFLFSLTNKKRYPIKPDVNAITYINDDFFIIGDDDLAIHNNFLNEPNKCTSKFPRNFGDSNTQQNELTGGQNYFNVVKMEVFTFYEQDE